jgi:predicted acylesterase/phospholipase RssA
MVQDEMAIDEQGGGISTGAIVGTAIAAGLIAFLIRRARARDEVKIESPADVPAAIWEQASDPDLRRRTAIATRAFMLERVLPEMKPILLDLLRDLQGYVDDGFKRVEKAVRDL